MRIFGSPAPSLTIGSHVNSPPLLKQWIRLGPKQLASHKHILGITGTGKSKMLEGMFLDLFRQGIGSTFVDPHGTSGTYILDVLASYGYFEKDPNAYDRLLYVEFREDDYFVPMNILRQQGLPHTVAGNFKEAIHRAWPATAGGSAPMMDTLLQDGVKVLISNRLSLTSLYDFLTVKEFRDEVLQAEKDEDIVSFFQNQFDKLSERDRADQAGAALRRAHLLTFNPVLKYSLGQAENILDFNHIIDNGISVLINLGMVQDLEARRLLGCILTIGYEQAAISREGTGRPRRQHHLILDEMAEFVSQSEEALSRMLSQTRKYELFTILAHQTWSQASLRLRGALQNCLVEVAFGIGRDDAEAMSRIMGRIDPAAILSEAKTDTQQDLYKQANVQWEEWIQHLVDLPPRNALLKVRGQPTVQIVTPEMPKPNVDPQYVERIKDAYRKKLTLPLSQINLVRYVPKPVVQTRRFGPAGSVEFKSE